jgi:hypothetical protein
MNAQTRLANRLASMVIGVGLAMVGLVFVALGITFLPVIGILIAIPVMTLSFNFLNPKLDVKEVCEESSFICTWPSEVGHRVS